MKLEVVALDYDGTIAVNGVMDSAVRLAIGELRRRGTAVVLATGRRLAELRSAAGDLTCFDAVVAENGAVIEFPLSGQHATIGHPPGAAFLAALRQRRIPFAVGESVVEVEAPAATPALEVIRALELPLVLAFNRGQLMILPQGVAKSTGLRHALFAMRRSIHNTIAIGDAENDHDLLSACEVGVAVAWGSAALRAVADEVIEGAGPPAVAAYLTGLAGQPRMAAAQMGRRHVLLGYDHAGGPVNLAIRGRTILIAGEPGTGKSWLAGQVCEQLILQGYSLCLIDPEGDYRTLESLPGVILLGGDDPPPASRELTRALRHPDVSVIVDLSRLGRQQKIEYLDTLLPLLIALRRQTGLPHKILLDEAHYFLGGANGSRLIDAELAGYILVTYRISDLPTTIRSARDSVVMVTHESDPNEARTLVEMCRPCGGESGVSAETFRGLGHNEAALLPGSEESGGRIRRFQIAPRLTTHVRHQAKYLDMPVAADQAFVFTGNGTRSARTLRQFIRGLKAASPASLAGHLRRHDFSRWLTDIFRDGPLAAHVATLESRIAADDPRAVADLIAQSVRGRYDTAERDPDGVARAG